MWKDFSINNFMWQVYSTHIIFSYILNVLTLSKRDKKNVKITTQNKCFKFKISLELISPTIFIYTNFNYTSLTYIPVPYY